MPNFKNQGAWREAPMQYIHMYIYIYVCVRWLVNCVAWSAQHAAHKADRLDTGPLEAVASSPDLSRARSLPGNYLVAFGPSRHRAWIRGHWMLLEALGPSWSGGEPKARESQIRYHLRHTDDMERSVPTAFQGPPSNLLQHCPTASDPGTVAGWAEDH